MAIEIDTSLCGERLIWVLERISVDNADAVPSTLHYWMDNHFASLRRPRT